jgi:hypothetical protein
LLTPANVDDREPVTGLVEKLFGKIVGDKGYISKDLVEHLRQAFGIEFITKLISNSKNRLPMSFVNHILL